jgi:hypothetical protein
MRADALKGPGMTSDEMQALQPGDMVIHRGTGFGYLVTVNRGGRVIVVRAVDMVDPRDWDRAAKSAGHGE